MFWKKDKEVELNKFDKFCNAIRLLNEIGMSIKDVYASNELIAEMKVCREKIELVFNSGCDLNRIDTTWDCFLDKTAKGLRKGIVKSKGPNFEGWLFGINIRRK